MEGMQEGGLEPEAPRMVMKLLYDWEVASRGRKEDM
jgi:hypothetical protein